MAKARIGRARPAKGNRRGTVLLAVAVSMFLVVTVWAASQTTVARTIQDLDRNDRLETAPGESYVVRTELGRAIGGRAKSRVPRIGFAQLTDAHVVDEESPLRVEYLDKFGPPLTSAYRPHEGISPQVLNEMVRQVRAAASPVTGRRVELVMTTGDNSDNTQLNEVRWFINVLDGRTMVDPNSGVPGGCAGAGAGGHLYDGVRGDDEYYEPDQSGPAGNNTVDGPGYAPDRAENISEAGRSSRVRDFPGLYEAMNKPFPAAGLGVPWYSIFGNHDGLILGNQPRNEALEQLAVGCLKVNRLSPGALTMVQALLADGLTVEERSRIYRVVTDDMIKSATASLLATDNVTVVPKDDRRVPLKKAEYIAEHFTTRGTPVGHGFTQANLASGQGNYSFKPRSGLRFIVLDSINENGYADGNIDDTQFRWIHAELLAAEKNRELAVLFAHHSLRTMNQAAATPFAPGDQGGDLSPLVHFGLGPNGQTASCTLVDPAVMPAPDETLRCLFRRHRSVIAFVVGHEHINRVTPFERSSGLGQAEGGFWEITTASHIDWPQQSRLLDILDNRDGTLSIFGTIIDHAAAPRPSGAVPTGATLTADGVSQLASISRELSYNDPDADNGEDGHADARGKREDRNVELLIVHPYRR